MSPNVKAGAAFVMFVLVSFCRRGDNRALVKKDTMLPTSKGDIGQLIDVKP